MASSRLPRILIADASQVELQALNEGLARAGFTVDQATCAREVFARVAEVSYEVVITELTIPEIEESALLTHFAENHPDTAVIILTEHGSIESAVDSMKKGAFDYFTKPASLEALVQAVHRAQEFITFKADNVLVHSQLQGCYRFDNIIGQSKPMQTLFRMIQRVAGTDSTVLIMGESGTGKELIANAIHHHSGRRDRPFVPINCGAIPEELMESELFGHERGAFTGALRERKGRFEIAHEGTVFLDEIGEMSPKLQVKLLRVLQERKFERVGSSRTIDVDVRVIAATNKNLEDAVAAGRFREDLYYRLNVIPFHVPPLRERDGDVQLLVHYFLQQHCRKKDISPKQISKSAMESLHGYNWPGNVRELENVIERLVILTDNDEIQADELPARMRETKACGSPALLSLGNNGIDLKKTLDDLEYHLIVEALKKAQGVKNQAAKYLGLNRTTLIEKMKKRKITYPAR
ncbi:MAG TPA: DNA-binding response regulator [Syntrophobacteraceae bacterium]|jgi:DNA-binding NtrC family response regulator|nr:DNA-binding response regulator [Syntrophobacteraceae bacterium]HBD08389.1 DNA-binding response regulator [Syntrophobacteraceae bacterium]